MITAKEEKKITISDLLLEKWCKTEWVIWELQSFRTEFVYPRMNLAMIISYLQNANYFQLRPKCREIEDADIFFLRCTDRLILLQAPVDKIAHGCNAVRLKWRCVSCVCFCCWLFILESCCVLGAVTAVSSANVISRSVGCESISFLGTITEDYRLSPCPPLSFHFQHLNQCNADCSTNTQQPYSETHQLSHACITWHLWKMFQKKNRS